MRTAAAPRRRWHPVAVGTGLLFAAATASIVDGARPVAPVGWLLMGAAAGFSTSGST
jgi:hypothetical protein